MTAGAARIAGMDGRAGAHRARRPIPADRRQPAARSPVRRARPLRAVGRSDAGRRPGRGDGARGGRRACAARGGVPYVIPVGGSSARRRARLRGGTRGAVPASSTALGVAPSRLYFGSGSRGTQAGLTLGAHLCRHRLRTARRCRERRRARESRAGAARGRARPRRCSAPTTRCVGREFFTDQGFIGDGYGLPTPDGLDAHAAGGPHRGAGARPHLHRQGAWPRSSRDVRARRRSRRDEYGGVPAHRRRRRQSSRAAAAERPARRAADGRFCEPLSPFAVCRN